MRDVGRTALAPFDFDRAHANLDDLRQDGNHIQAGGFFQCVISVALNLKAALAQGRVAGRFVVAEAVDQDAVEAGFHCARLFVPLDVLGWRAGADGIRRFAAGVGGEPAAAFVHDAQAAETENFNLDTGIFDDMLDLGQCQNPRQNRAADSEFALAKIDCFVAGGRTLYREVQALLWMTVAGVIEQANVSQDNCVNTEVDRSINGFVPLGDAPGLREGIDREEYLAALCVGVANAFGHGFLVEVEAGKVAGVGVVFETEVNRVGTVIDGGLERRQAASWANEIGQGTHGGILKVKR